MQVYDHEKWRNHRSGAQHYLRSMLQLPYSHILRAVLPPCLWVLSVSMLIGINVTLSAKGWLPWYLRLPLMSPGTQLLSLLIK